MTNEQIKNLDNSELIRLIDKGDHFDQIKELVKVDEDFRYRITELRIQNKKQRIESREELIQILKENLKSAPEDMKNRIQEVIDGLTK